MNFLHTYNPEPIALTIGSLDIYWYGLIIAGAVLIGFIVTLQLAKKKQVSLNHIYNLLFWLVIFSLIGGRIGHIIGEWNYYQLHSQDIIKIWQGGIAIHGILIASLVVVFIYSKLKKVSFWLLTDLIVVSLPLMQAIGRWGNYLNQELFGKPTEVVWGIPIDLTRRPLGFEQYTYFHPVFLYESILMLIVFSLLFFLWQKNKLMRGQLTLLYFIFFAVIRFSLDFLKIDMLTFGPLLLTQWVSIFLFIIAIYFLVRKPDYKVDLNKK